MADWRDDPDWHLYATETGVLPLPRRKKPPVEAERSGDGNWAVVRKIEEVEDADGRRGLVTRDLQTYVRLGL